MYTAHDPHFASSGPLLNGVASWLVELFDLRDCWFEPFPFDVQLPRIEPGRVVLPATEPGVRDWHIGGGVELPVRAHGLTLGRFILLPAEETCGVALAANDRASALELVASIAPTIADAVLAEP
jgi:hypothetical protein